MPSRNGTRSKAARVPPVAIVVSRYNATITDRLLEGARGAYAAAGGKGARLVIVEAPGSFELPALALAAAKRGRVRGVVALGCLIRGETRHDQYLAQAVAHGLVEVTLRTGVPVAFGVLTTENVAQARARAGGAHGNKGAEAMEALLQTIAAIDTLGGRGRGGARQPSPQPPPRGRGSSPARPDKARARRAP